MKKRQIPAAINTSDSVSDDHDIANGKSPKNSPQTAKKKNATSSSPKNGNKNADRASNSPKNAPMEPKMSPKSSPKNGERRESVMSRSSPKNSTATSPKAKRFLTKAEKKHQADLEKLGSLQAELDKTRMELVEQKQANAGLTDELGKVNVEKAELDGRVEKLQNVLMSKRNEIKELTEVVTNKDAEIGKLKEQVEEATKVKEDAIGAKQVALNRQEELQEERNEAVRKMEQAERFAEETEGKYIVTKKANDAAQAMLEDLQNRERERNDQERRRRKKTKATEESASLQLEALKEEFAELQRKFELEVKVFKQREKQNHDEMVKFRTEFHAQVAENNLLVEKLGRPRPTLEMISEQMKEDILFLASSMNDRISEKDAFRGGETLRWKMIKAKVENLSDQVARIFDVLSKRIMELEAIVNRKDERLAEHVRDIEQTQDRIQYYEHERGMLAKLFFPEKNMKLKEQVRNSRDWRPPPATTGSNNHSDGGIDNRKEQNSLTRKPVALRARLLLSEIRSDKVANLIEKHRTWDETCSTLLLSCCTGCGAFFLDTDMAWPCQCSHAFALTSQHQEYCLYHCDDDVQAQINERLRSP